MSLSSAASILKREKELFFLACACSQIFTNPGITLPVKIDSSSYLEEEKEGGRNKREDSLTQEHNKKQLK